MILTHGVTSYRGAEIDMHWDPVGDGESCIAHVLTEYKTSSGTTCTYLNRGTAVPVTVSDVPGHFHVSWANDTTLTSCSSGAILAIGFAFDGCASDTAQFRLCSVLLLDDSLRVTEVAADSLGTPATVWGGGNYVAECTDHLETPTSTPCDTCKLRIGPLPQTYTVVTGTVMGITPWLDPDSTTCNPDSCATRWDITGEPGTDATFDSITGLFTWIVGPVGSDYNNVRVVVSAGGVPKDTVRCGIHVVPRDSIHFGLLHAKNDIIFGTGSKIDSMRAEWTNFTVRPMTDPFPSQETDALVVDAQERGLDVVINVTTDADSDDFAYWPPGGAGTDSTYRARVKNLARRYSIDSPIAVRAPGLVRSVDWWHVEEESGFLRGDDCDCGCDYMQELVATRQAVLAGNPYARILLIGLQSDWSWLDAYVTGRATTVEPVDDSLNQSSVQDSSLTGFRRFQRRVRNWLHTGDSTECNLSHSPLAYWYDAIDLHSFERRDAIRGKVHWLQNLEDFHGHMPIWVNEAGGPAYVHAVEGGKVVYSDVLNSGSVFKNYGEALANGVQRYAWQTFPGSDIGPLYRNIALFDDPTHVAVQANQFVPKPSFQAYRAVTGLVKNYSSAYDYRLQDSIPYNLDIDTLVIGDSTVYDTVRVYPPLDLRDQEACTMNMQFVVESPFLQSNVVWRGAHSDTTIKKVWVQTQAFDSTAVFSITHRPLYADQGPEVETLPATVDTTTFHRVAADSLLPDTTIVVTRALVDISDEPIMISCDQPFTVYQARFDSTGADNLTGVSAPRNGRRSWISVRQQATGSVLLDWSLARAGDAASIHVIDVLGRVVRTIGLDTRRAAEGRATWDVTRRSRGGPAAGVYFAVLRTGDQVAASTRFMVLR